MLDQTAVKIIVAFGIVVCALLIVLKIGLIIFNLCKNRSHRIPYIRNYKKGSFISNYLVMFFIYFIGILYEESSISVAFSSSVTAASDFVILKYNAKPMTKLMEASDVYSHLVYVCYMLVVVGTVLLAFSITQQYLWRAEKEFIEKKTRRKNKALARIFKKEKIFILGYNSDVLSICDSDDKNRFKYIVDVIGKDDRDKLYINNYPFLSKEPDEWIKEHIDAFSRADATKSTFIVHTGDDKKNIAVCKCFAEKISELSEEQFKERFANIRVFVFGDPKYQAIYQDLAEKGKGRIFYINKYKKIAADFIERYPLSLFMDGDKINYNTGLLNEDVDINVALVGFGRVNRHIFLASVACNQFITDTENGPAHKPINYYFYDKEHSEQDKNLNHDFYRFERKYKTINDFDQYLPMPTFPVAKMEDDERYKHMDVNHSDFYASIKEIVTRDPSDSNFIVISYGNDLENLDMAHKLVEKLKEWEIDNTIVFVRAFDWKKEDTPLKEEHCYFFGNESGSVFDLDKILSDKFYNMAEMRKNKFDGMVEKVGKSVQVVNNGSAEERPIQVNEKWHRTRSQIQRDSNFYACLSLRFKLNLMGLDYRAVSNTEPEKKMCKNSKNQIGGISKKEYEEIYGKEDRFYPPKDGMEEYAVSYGKGQTSLRTRLAIQEHYRWNSFVISRGIVPAPIKKILDETKKDGENIVYSNGTNYELRQHGNLTTFEGLMEFSRIIAERDGVEAADRDRLKYRYQILDDAYEFLTENGFEIVHKRPCQEHKNCDCL